MRCLDISLTSRQRLNNILQNNFVVNHFQQKLPKLLLCIRHNKVGQNTQPFSVLYLLVRVVLKETKIYAIHSYKLCCKT